MRPLFLVVATLVLAAACAAPAPAPVAGPREATPPPLDPADEAVAPAVERAERATAALFGTLVGRLGEAMAAGGPVAAIEVCSREAQTLTARIAEAHGLELGRTSHRLRNPRNAPPSWVEPWLAANAGRPAAEARLAAYDLGDRVGVVKPIGTLAPCTTCHGTAIDPAVAEAIAKAYPEDRAVGFSEGELRGAFWVEVPKTR